MKKQIELELGWLVRYLPKDIEKSPSFEIIQAYLDQDDPTVKDERVRKKKGVFTHTIKRFAGSSEESGFCEEETKIITEKEFVEFLSKSKKKIRKKRYLLKLDSGLIAEVDLYEDNLEGLNVVEVEFPNLENWKKFSPPDWFGKEVTDSVGIWPFHIANMTITEVNKINQSFEQKLHNFE